MCLFVFLFLVSLPEHEKLLTSLKIAIGVCILHSLQIFYSFTTFNCELFFFSPKLRFEKELWRTIPLRHYAYGSDLKCLKDSLSTLVKLWIHHCGQRIWKKFRKSSTVTDRLLSYPTILASINWVMMPHHDWVLAMFWNLICKTQSTSSHNNEHTMTVLSQTKP